MDIIKLWHKDEAREIELSTFTRSYDIFVLFEGKLEPVARNVSVDNINDLLKHEHNKYRGKPHQIRYHDNNWGNER
jgi:hypothetical protein